MQVRSVPASARLLHCMLALGRRQPPKAVCQEGRIYRHAQTVKHDFFAMTAFYDDESGHRIVVKMSREADFFGVPLIGIGRWLCRREMRFYRILEDLPNVPRLLGSLGRTAFVHSFVPGRPLARDAAVPDGFFANLRAVLEEVHRRGIAYADANKCPNMLLGDDGLPYLIDFQISWDLYELGNNPINRWWRARLQREDIYHLLKHKRRLRPDELTEQELEFIRRPSALIRLHRWITKPYFLVRRAIFRRLRQSGRVTPETTA
jgi:RIO-like serine/threonine protein kinase